MQDHPRSIHGVYLLQQLRPPSPLVVHVQIYHGAEVLKPHVDGPLESFLLHVQDHLLPIVRIVAILGLVVVPLTKGRAAVFEELEEFADDIPFLARETYGALLPFEFIGDFFEDLGRL